MKTSILSTFSFVGLIMFSACAGEQTANKQKNKQEPETKGMTEFVVNEDTRTTGEYTGSSLKFYWTDERLLRESNALNMGFSTNWILNKSMVTQTRYTSRTDSKA